jgi:hypothetical protein
LRQPKTLVKEKRADCLQPTRGHNTKIPVALEHEGSRSACLVQVVVTKFPRLRELTTRDLNPRPHQKDASDVERGYIGGIASPGSGSHPSPELSEPRRCNEDQTVEPATNQSNTSIASGTARNGSMTASTERLIWGEAAGQYDFDFSHSVDEEHGSLIPFKKGSKSDANISPGSIGSSRYPPFKRIFSKEDPPLFRLVSKPFNWKPLVRTKSQRFPASDQLLAQSLHVNSPGAGTITTAQLRKSWPPGEG